MKKKIILTIAFVLIIFFMLLFSYNAIYEHLELKRLVELGTATIISPTNLYLTLYSSIIFSFGVIIENIVLLIKLWKKKNQEPPQQNN